MQVLLARRVGSGAKAAVKVEPLHADLGPAAFDEGMELVCQLNAYPETLQCYGSKVIYLPSMQGGLAPWGVADYECGSGAARQRFCLHYPTHVRRRH